MHYKLDRLLTTLLILSAFSMGLIAAVGTYIFTAYTLRKPAHAPFASFLGGVVTFLVGWFCLSLVDDVYDFSFPVSFQYTNILSSADTLYMCYCIDVDRGAMHKAEVFDAVRLGSYWYLSLLTLLHSLKVDPQPHAPTTRAYECIIGHFLGDLSSLNICDAI